MRSPFSLARRRWSPEAKRPAQMGFCPSKKIFQKFFSVACFPAEHWGFPSPWLPDALCQPAQSKNKGRVTLPFLRNTKSRK